jgi:two-component system chemotaxis response regulator CheY
MRDMLNATLSEAGFNVHLAEDGQHGLEVLDGIEPDCIVTDLNMPRLDGFGFVDAVRKQDEMLGVPILILTTESGAELKQRARAAGATGWIVKPYDEDKLVATIKRISA